jgi:7-cyano-7-deazaguanine synthase
MKNKAVIMLSGGLDSSVALASAVREFSLKAITFDYGQAQSNFELASARRIATAYDVPLEVIDISGLRRAFLGLTEGVTIGIGLFGPRPNCPFALFGLASTYAIVSGSQTLVAGVHKGDFKNSHGAKQYLKNYGKEVAKLQGIAFSLHCPFLEMMKPDVIRLGAKLKVPFQQTRSCTTLHYHHCGECPECAERKKSFLRAGIADPTKYEK